MELLGRDSMMAILAKSGLQSQRRNKNNFSES
jgi:hypothetical protein